MRQVVQSCVFFFAIISILTHVHAQQTAKRITCAASPDSMIGFLEFRPPDYGSQLHPLIIFLHGRDERGNGSTQINLVSNNGIPRYCANRASLKFTVNGKSSSFIVLSPQLNKQYGSWQTYYIKEMIKYAKANLQIDTNRIYITGMSLGGGGVWNAITESPELTGVFAAAAPVCGTQEMNDANFCKTVAVTHLPIWAFHSIDDKTVAVQATQHAEILGNICKLLPAEKFTYYQSGGHSRAWINAYDTGHITVKVAGGTLFTASPNLYEWFLTHIKAGSNYVLPSMDSTKKISRA
ncbi:MAG: prolyl oligopeptidase family serine peptidase [Bacteroidota bacterium]